MSQEKTEVGACTACGTTVYEYEGPVNPRSHPQLAHKVKDRDGVILCSVCCYNPRVVSGLVGHHVVVRIRLTPPAAEPET